MAKRKMRTPEERSADPSIIDLLQHACDMECATSFDRADQMAPCPIGKESKCCKNCSMGPCRLVKPGQVGVCGATIETVVARNFARMVAVGTSAHADHGRGLAYTLLEVAEGNASDYTIRDTKKLVQVAGYLDVPVEGKSVNEIARDVAQAALAQYGRTEGVVQYTKRAPEKRQELWRELGLTPRSIDREVIEMLHRTHIGNDQDYKHLIDQSMRTSLGDGWGGSMIGTDISDILFGTPGPIQGEVGLGVLSEDDVNIVVHGHEPTLSEMIVIASQDPELSEYAQSKGANAIVGMRFTASMVMQNASELLAYGTGVVLE